MRSFHHWWEEGAGQLGATLLSGDPHVLVVTLFLLLVKLG